jgi:hypothetical protein
MPLPLCLLMCAVAAPSAFAQADLQRCRAVADDRARLACYDALAAAPAPARPAAPVAAAAAVPAAPAAAAAPAPAPPSTFGLSARSASGAADEVQSHLPGLFEGWDPGTRLRLANGQVWRVMDGSSAATALREPKVRIKRAALGTYVMEIEGLNRSPRVQRLE